MKCPFCAEEIQAEALVCRFCGAVKREGQWQGPSAPTAERPRGWFTMRFAGAAFGVSALLELLSIGSAVPMFGVVRDGLVANVYHAVYVVLFTALCIGLWGARRWGYRLLFAGACFYTIDTLRYVLDRTGMKAQIDQQLAPFREFQDVIDTGSIMQVTTLTALLFVACWWGFVLYVRSRRDYFAT